MRRIPRKSALQRKVTKRDIHPTESLYNLIREVLELPQENLAKAFSVFKAYESACTASSSPTVLRKLKRALSACVSDARVARVAEAYAERLARGSSTPYGVSFREAVSGGTDARDRIIQMTDALIHELDAIRVLEGCDPNEWRRRVINYCDSLRVGVTRFAARQEFSSSRVTEENLFREVLRREGVDDVDG